MRDHAGRMLEFFFLQYALVSVYYYFIALISLPVVSFMNFSLLYSLFLHTFITSNDRLCYFICHYHVLVRYLHCYRTSFLLRSSSFMMFTLLPKSSPSRSRIHYLWSWLFHALRSSSYSTSLLYCSNHHLTILIPFLSLVRRVNALDLHSRFRTRPDLSRENQILAK